MFSTMDMMPTGSSVSNALYGIVAMYISSLTMDTVVYGSMWP